MRNALNTVELDADVDLEKIADRLDGYSGSDITGICRFYLTNILFILTKNYSHRDAAMAPMRERLRASNVLVDNNAWKKALGDKPDLTIRMEHFDTALANIMPSVSQSTVKQYLNWMEEFGSK